MKIGILTQPLHDNYGGLLQAYALKEVLKEMGHEVVIVNRSFKKLALWRKYASIAKSKITGRKLSPNILTNKSLLNEVSAHTRKFREKYFPELSDEIIDQKGMERLNSMGFDAYVVGSDQCWRPRYSPSIRNYFLDFAVNDKQVKRISYAASFGVSHWEFTEKDTSVCKELLQKFDAVSVREDSAINLLRDNLGRPDAIHVLDPTMLLRPEQYAKIVEKEQINSSAGDLKVYVLDKTSEKDNVIHIIEDKLHLKAFEVLPQKSVREKKVTKHNLDKFVYPNPALWLRGFQDARYVITDSFHGTVFSILHNIPFITIGNAERGMSRFQSLLTMFGLQDRLITDLASFDANKLIAKDIDWLQVNKILDLERKKAINFLKYGIKQI